MQRVVKAVSRGLGCRAGSRYPQRTSPRDRVTAFSRNIVIPPRKHRKQPREYGKHRYGERHLVECFFNKIKRFRRVFTRYDKLLRNYLSFAYLGAIHIWLR